MSRWANIGDTFDVREILFPLTSAGEGHSQGVELYVEKRLTSKLYGQGNLSFSRTRHAALDGVLRPGSFDYPFVFNLLGGYRLSPLWEISAWLSFLSRRPSVWPRSSRFSTIVWVLSLRLQDASVADVLWGLGFVRYSLAVRTTPAALSEVSVVETSD